MDGDKNGFHRVVTSAEWQQGLKALMLRAVLKDADYLGGSMGSKAAF
jgi:hypothetical protein